MNKKEWAEFNYSPFIIKILTNPGVRISEARSKRCHHTRTTFKRLDKALCYKGLSNVSEKAIFERKCILNQADCYETVLIKILKKQ